LFNFLVVAFFVRYSGLDRPLLRGILKCGYKVPTPIQRKVIPLAIQGTDIVAMARTGVNE